MGGSGSYETCEIQSIPLLHGVLIRGFSTLLGSNAREYGDIDDKTEQAGSSVLSYIGYASCLLSLKSYNYPPDKERRSRDTHPYSRQMIHNSRHTPPLPRSLGHFTLRRIICISLINRQIILRLTRRVPDTRPLLNSSLPSPQTSPNLLILPTFAFGRNPRSALEVVEDPQPHDPRRDDEIDQTRLRAEEKRPRGMHLGRELLELVEELSAHFGKTFSITRGLKLQKPVPRGDDSRGAEVRPNASARALVGVGGEKARCVLRIGVFEELADDGALVEGFVVVLQGGHQAARVEGEERGGLVVWVHFDVLVGDLLLFQDGPGALHEGAAGGGLVVGHLDLEDLYY